MNNSRLYVIREKSKIFRSRGVHRDYSTKCGYMSSNFYPLAKWFSFPINLVRTALYISQLLPEKHERLETSVLTKD